MKSGMEFSTLWTTGQVLMGITLFVTLVGFVYHATGAGLIGQTWLAIGSALFAVTAAFTVTAVVKVYTQYCRLKFRRRSLHLDWLHLSKKLINHPINSITSLKKETKTLTRYQWIHSQLNISIN